MLPLYIPSEEPFTEPYYEDSITLRFNLMSFPKREELSFLTVLAFPKDSKIGLQANIRYSIDNCDL